MITSHAETIRRLFATKGATPNLRARYNVAPTQDAPVVRLRDGQRELAMLRRGLIPRWSKDPKIVYSTINARAETVDKKPAFRDAFKSRRCLVVADGFYEWQARRNTPQGALELGLVMDDFFAMTAASVLRYVLAFGPPR